MRPATSDPGDQAAAIASIQLGCAMSSLSQKARRSPDAAATPMLRA